MSLVQSANPTTKELPIPVVKKPDISRSHFNIVLVSQESSLPKVESYIHQLANSAISDCEWAQLIQNENGNYIYFPYYQTPVAFTHPLPNWYSELKERITKLGNRTDGWKGPDSQAPKPKTVKFALEMLLNLGSNRIPRRPSIGLDFEGTFSFSWFDESVSADMTVYDDGTYSFFITNGKNWAGADAEKINKPIHSDLINILRS